MTSCRTVKTVASNYNTSLLKFEIKEYDQVMFVILLAPVAQKLVSDNQWLNF